MNPSRAARILQWALALVAAFFGLLTLLAGTRVLMGADPGYLVYRPLLVYNTVMGLLYVAAGALIWNSAHRGKQAAAAICLLNLLVLAFAAWLHSEGQGVALDSVQAMMLRTGVWLLLFLGLAWLSRRRP
jgi:hypothetical protein